MLIHYRYILYFIIPLLYLFTTSLFCVLSHISIYTHLSSCFHLPIEEELEKQLQLNSSSINIRSRTGFCFQIVQIPSGNPMPTMQHDDDAWEKEDMSTN